MTLRARIAAMQNRLDDLFAGASHIEVARKVGLVETTVINLRFRNVVPDARQLILIADAYAVSPDWLVLGLGESRPDIYRNPSFERSAS